MSASPTSPFTRREALARGTTVHQLAGPTFQRLFHNLYLPATSRADRLARARGVLRLAPGGAYASHHTAIALWGGLPPDDAATHISVPAGTRSVRRGVRAHRAPAGNAVVKHLGVLLSPPDQAFLDLASAGVGLVDLVTAGDSLVRAGRTTPELLVEATLRSRRPGVRRARQAAQLVRVGVDSGPETRLRLLVVLAGLPEPTVNHIVREADGEWLARFDLSYPTLKLIIEYDGRHHADDPRQWSRDLRRREQLERDGWRLIVVNADALFNHPDETLDRIWTGLGDKGARLPPRRAAAWAQHFIR